MKHLVVITETLCKHIIVEAGNPEEAEDIAISAYTNGYIDPPDYVIDTNFECIGEASDTECMHYEELEIEG